MGNVGSYMGINETAFIGRGSSRVLKLVLPINQCEAGDGEKNMNGGALD